ncbi:MAG: extracellular solute-binding protein [Acidobacteriaceae bacterium]
MISRRVKFLIPFILLTLVGCTALPFQLGNPPGTGTASSEVGIKPTSTALTAEPSATLKVPASTGTSTQSLEMNTLRIWLPPEFDPQADNPASQLLKARLDQFVLANPDVRLDVRVKAVEGSGGLLDALVAASAAAPLALPDLVLLPRPLIESATLKGLLHPFDQLTSIMDDPGWFEFARQLALIKDSTYAIPFAGNALAMVYHPSQIESPPHDLEGVLATGKVLLFTATDSQALFTLCLYLGMGADLQDGEGRPALDETALRNVLEFYQGAGLAGVMPYWLTQYSSDGQVWETFSGENGAMAVTWAATYLQQESNAPEDLALAPLPSDNGIPFTLATGWGWTLAGQDPAREKITVKLVEFLAEKGFLAQWSQAAGYLPPRSDSLLGWQQVESKQVIAQITSSARLMPAEDLISSLGPPIEQAVVDVLKSQSDPQSAAQAVIAQVNQP